jgi:hypothetical protein
LAKAQSESSVLRLKLDAAEARVENTKEILFKAKEEAVEDLVCREEGEGGKRGDRKGERRREKAGGGRFGLEEWEWRDEGKMKGRVGTKDRDVRGGTSD